MKSQREWTVSKKEINKERKP